MTPGRLGLLLGSIWPPGPKPGTLEALPKACSSTRGLHIDWHVFGSVLRSPSALPRPPWHGSDCCLVSPLCDACFRSSSTSSDSALTLHSSHCSFCVSFFVTLLRLNPVTLLKPHSSRSLTPAARSVVDRFHVLHSSKQSGPNAHVPLTIDHRSNEPLQ